jgi:hypothetical protein
MTDRVVVVVVTRVHVRIIGSRVYYKKGADHVMACPMRNQQRHELSSETQRESRFEALPHYVPRSETRE